MNENRNTHAMQELSSEKTELRREVGLFGGKNPDEEDFAAARKFAQACMNKALNHEI